MKQFAAIGDGFSEAFDSYGKAIDLVETQENGAVYVRIEPQTIFTDIADERNRQDAQWGGADHDDQHSLADWFRFIDLQIVRGLQSSQNDENEAARERLVKIAALSVAALESYDRKGGEKTPTKSLIVINGKEVEVTQSSLGYEEILRLAEEPDRDGYTVVHSFDRGRDGEIVHRGKTVRLYLDSRFDVVLTNNA